MVTLRKQPLPIRSRGLDQNALAVGFAGWQGHAVISTPQAGGPAFLPPREPTSHLAPSAGPLRSRSLLHGTEQLSSTSCGPSSPGRNPAVGTNHEAAQEAVCSLLSSPPHSYPACWLSPPESSSTVCPLFPSFLSPFSSSLY